MACHFAPPPVDSATSHPTEGRAAGRRHCEEDPRCPLERFELPVHASARRTALRRAIIEADGVAGVVIEAGTALGGSAIVLATSKAAGRPMRLYDTFGMIPPLSEHDGQDVHDRYAVIANGKASGIDGGTHYGYIGDLVGQIKDNFRQHEAPLADVSFVLGSYDTTLIVDFDVAHRAHRLRLVRIGNDLS